VNTTAAIVRWRKYSATWSMVGVRSSSLLEYFVDAAISASSSDTSPWLSTSMCTCTSMATRAPASMADS